MRKTWPSRNAECTTCWRLRAEARSVPNGFSITTRTSEPSWRSRRLAFSASVMTGKYSGDVDR